MSGSLFPMQGSYDVNHRASKMSWKLLRVRVEELSHRSVEIIGLKLQASQGSMAWGNLTMSG